MNSTVTQDNLEKIRQKWDSYKKPADSEYMAWKLIEQTCLKIQEEIFQPGYADAQSAEKLRERLEEIILPCFLLCYSIGLDLAAGEMASRDSSAYLMAATSPIDEFVVGSLEETPGTNDLTIQEERRCRVKKIAAFAGKAANDVCILGIYDYSCQHPDNRPFHK